MSQSPLPTEPPVVPTDAWSALPSDLQQRAVRLLTRLAFAQFRQHSLLPTKEIHHDCNTQHSQDSSRSS
jgi:hypothetical protein